MRQGAIGTSDHYGEGRGRGWIHLHFNSTASGGSSTWHDLDAALSAIDVQ